MNDSNNATYSATNIQSNTNKKQAHEQANSPLRSKPNLGITTEFASSQQQRGVQPIDQKSLTNKLENNLNKYRLQEIAQKNHSGHRICACMKTLAPLQDSVELHYNAEENHAHYRNLMRCDNVWLCPVCSGRITSERAEEIRQAYGYAVDVLGYRMQLVTYTLSHKNFDSLKSNVNDLREARRKMRSGRKWQEFKEASGYVGCISSLETPWNPSGGWHTHVHELMILDPEKSEYGLHTENDKLDRWVNSELSTLWLEALDKVGRSASWEHGIDVTSADEKIAWYIEKYGKLPEGKKWDAGLEMTKTMSKTKGESLHPFQILALSESDQEYLKLWYEYAEAFDGKAQLFWTKGLKELLLVEDVENVDEQLESDMVIVIEREQWRVLVKLKARARLLNYTILTHGNEDKIHRWIDDHENYLLRYKENRYVEPT